MAKKRMWQAVIVLAAILITGVLFAQPAGAADCFYYNEAIGYVCQAEPQPETFLDPAVPIDSFLQNRRYARAADLTNVYPEPSRAATPVRNLGDGYLWVTLSGQQYVDGANWYLINPGEWVHEEDLTPGEISEFIGVEMVMQPERPFGWMVADRVAPSTAPGVEPDGSFSKMRRYTFFEVYDAVPDSEGWLWYDIGDGRWMKQTYVSLVDVNRRPADVGPNDFWVEIDLYEQSLAAYVGDRMVFATLVSSGLNRWPTNEGLFQVWDRWEETKMSGAEGKIDYYFIEDVPHTMFFDWDIALHGAYWHDRFGYKHSHGCVNMPPLAAEWLFNWSAPVEQDLWVWVHTSDPLHYFDKFVDDDAAAAPAPEGVGFWQQMADFLAALPARFSAWAV